MNISAKTKCLVTLGMVGGTCLILQGCWWDGSSNPAPASPPPPPATYSIGGSVSGLTTEGLVLTNGTDTVSVAANATTFTFRTAVASGGSYAVTVSTQPANANCSVTQGSGTVASNAVTSVSVSCMASTYKVGGTISGLTASGLVLANGSDTVSPAANATTFTLSSAVASGTGYAVSVQNQPTGLTCTVTGGSGTVAGADVTNVAVSCAAAAASGFTPLAGQTSCPAGYPDQNGTGSAASLPVPFSLVADAGGNVYAATAFSVIDKISAAGVVSTLAGQYANPGETNGTGTAAQFGGNTIVGGLDAAGNLYVSQSGSIRKITPAGLVSTLAGSTDGTQGYVDGAGSTARFSAWGLAVTADGTSYVADYGNQVIRKVTSSGVASTLAGQPGAFGYTDGLGTAAQFRDPKYPVVDTAGTVYVSDQLDTMVRKIAADGTVTTLAGATASGWADGSGTAARFYGIEGLALGPSGSIFVLDQPSQANGSNAYSSNWGAIRRIDADGTVSTVVTSTAASPFYGVPSGSHPQVVTLRLQSIGSAPDGTLYVSSQCAVGTIGVP